MKHLRNSFTLNQLFLYSVTNIASKMQTNGEVVNKVRVVLGAQWGDEGKGKLVDLLAENADVVARCQVSF